MPQQHHHGLPPVVFDRGIELGLAAALAFSGFRAILDAAATPASVNSLGACLAIIFRVASMLGGVMVFAGLLYGSTRAIARTAPEARKRARRAAFGRTLERAGLWITAGSLLSYAVALVASGPTLSATLVVCVLLSVTIGCVARAIFLRRVERVILEALRKANQDQPGQAGHG